MLTHERQTVAMKLAAALHHSRGVEPDDTNNARPGQKPEFSELYEDELGGTRPDRLAGVGPQERVQRHTVEPNIVPYFDVPALHMVEQLVEGDDEVELFSQRAKLLRARPRDANGQRLFGWTSMASAVGVDLCFQRFGSEVSGCDPVTQWLCHRVRQRERAPQPLWLTSGALSLA